MKISHQLRGPISLTQHTWYIYIYMQKYSAKYSYLKKIKTDDILEQHLVFKSEGEKSNLMIGRAGHL